ncbi:hypothetical protein [Mycoplana ramosa]|uniref:Uncharacterized protein n=1 Tax=Mycoplana ramosa TaxID=40837 RepID=A0ABW3YXN9_MYCRA
MNDPDDLDVFLEGYSPDAKLEHALLLPYRYDPIPKNRILEDSSCVASLERTALSDGIKVLDQHEHGIRSVQFLDENHAKWSEHFRDYVLGRGVPTNKLDAFIMAFAKIWVDGRKDRHFSPEMLSIKASIRDLDRLRNPKAAGRFVIDQLDEDVAPLLTPDEMAAIFDANAGLIEALLPDYIDALGDRGPGSLGGLYVRRGVFMEHTDSFRRELHYLSSYSLALGPVEQFAQTGASRNKGMASIFSAPIGAIQNRVVAFAPFIAGMNLSQLELVVAPPTRKMPLTNHGLHAGILEFSFE